MAVLEGGPKDLPNRIVPVESPDSDVRIPFRGGYEHFTPTPRHKDTPNGDLPVYEWSYHTSIAE